MKRKITVVIALFLLVFGANSASAAPIELGFLIDSSGSIGSSNFFNMKSDIADAFSNVLPTDGSIEVSIVNFSTYSITVADSLLIDSQDALDSLVASVDAMTYQGGGTAMSTGINTLTGLLDFTGEEQIFNILTDGYPNSSYSTILARDAAIAAGVDEIDAEFIGSVGSTGYNFLLNEIVYPQPGTLAPPYDPGFVVAVDFDNLQDAFESKLQAVTGVPEPSTMFLIGTGLIGLAGLKRKFKKN